MRQRKRGSATSRVILYAILIITIATMISLGLWWSGSLKPISSAGQEQVFVVEEGMNAAQVAEKLEEMKVIRSSAVFRQLSRMEKADAKLVAGVYYLSPAMSSPQILEILLKGPVPDIIKVTIPEGYTVAQIVTVLSQKGLGTEEDLYQAMQSFQAKDYIFLNDVPQRENRLEGFLFPDTYFFDKESKPKEVIDRFLQRFDQELTPDTEARLKELDISVYTWATKASIVEREAAKADERPIIAGVFENRLKKGMALESCATVQYVLDEIKPVLSLEDIEIDSPYNTYKHPGLPPGPIANPGHASLSAVLYPTQTDYLFFVAKNDGSHAFARTFEEHLSNVNRYQ